MDSSQHKLLDDDTTAAPKLNLSVGFLRADRRSAEPRIPAYRVGDRWLYDVPFIIDTLRRQALQRPPRTRPAKASRGRRPAAVKSTDNE